MKMLSPMSRQTDGAACESRATLVALDPRARGEPDAIVRPASRNLRRWWAVFAMLPFVTSVSGCGLMAAPCRVASAGLKIVPGVGGVLAAPTDACAAVID
ncbi:lipoprotein [Pandoraea morbifera]|uniref:Lipoprotein n=1 Tax=Pandoraea morbifera TaxID=2508300 RepID=A0A5E4TCR0_9BURK|nr:DUF6726 family protein [Pandoraea morbifera]VVD84733.1 lipoprotein [Pandoraea morbifera]